MNTYSSALAFVDISLILFAMSLHLHCLVHTILFNPCYHQLTHGVSFFAMPSFISTAPLEVFI